MRLSIVAVALVALAATNPSQEWEWFDGVAYPPHTTSAGRVDTTPVESNDVTYPDDHASFAKDGPPGPGVEIATDMYIYGTATRKPADAGP
jgi:hypothetical protein